MAFEVMEWVKESDQDLVLLLVDFEKTYDKVNWMFLLESMRKLGFSDQWINQTKSLYKEAYTSMVVNGKRRQTFIMERAVR